MPINNYLPDVKNPVTNRHGELPTTQVLSHLESIKVELLNAPSLEDLKTYLPQWCTATWEDSPRDSSDFGKQEIHDILIDMWQGNVLPSALETIGMTFLLSNIDLIDVTHILRHRTFSFSAICSADRDMRHDKCLLKPSIELKPEFLKRYLDIVMKSKDLYSDMVDSDEISLLDARTILPRCLEHHYYMRGNIKDILHFLRQRLDRQIQPESDNIIALKMWIEIVKKYPQMKRLIDLNAPDMWYVKTAPTGRSSNIYMPELPRNDIFEYKEQWFLYKKQRHQMSGGEVFRSEWNALVDTLNSI